MSTHILLINFTQKGIESVKESPSRADAFKSLCRQHGAEMKTFYLTMGRYDLVAIVEAPDDLTVAKLVLALAARGNVRTETLRAFPEAEYRSIIAALP
jgi:uncharacterized protein with GYD domain